MASYTLAYLSLTLYLQSFVPSIGYASEKCFPSDRMKAEGEPLAFQLFLENGSENANQWQPLIVTTVLYAFFLVSTNQKLLGFTNVQKANVLIIHLVKC